MDKKIILLMAFLLPWEFVLATDCGPGRFQRAATDYCKQYLSAGHDCECKDELLNPGEHQFTCSFLRGRRNVWVRPNPVNDGTERDCYVYIEEFEYRYIN